MHEHDGEMDEIDAKSQSSEGPESGVLQDTSRVGYKEKSGVRTVCPVLQPSDVAREDESWSGRSRFDSTINNSSRATTYTQTVQYS